ncbi:hypothetical protein DNU06_12500 [Putridiphycobacter roseus]|uniref:Uncharacterized protein n=1 Tax=Putridiphycobacter roseus TaxID=2219161 RepID=A0A2W1NPW8_9FLAO|nr:hypothetical protein [Putridiphycobacter roseus]PZE16668.1 hypothetical protein DNU06_12500 [Putridiphycobacter roseus]
MLLKSIILRKTDEFEAAIQDWSDSNEIKHEIFDGSQELYELADAIVLFHEDYNISKENASIKDLFSNNGKFSHSIDVNGTLMASVSSFVFWLENHKPKSVLIIGDDKLITNKKFSTYLERLSERIK